jgi:hypothetical protein
MKLKSATSNPFKTFSEQFGFRLKGAGLKGAASV